MNNNQTNELEKRKNELRQLLKDVGWSRKELADKIADDKARLGKREDEYGNKNEYEKLKKRLFRKDTKPAGIQEYIDFICNYRTNRNKNFIQMPDMDISDFSDETLQKNLDGIRAVSENFFKNKKDNSNS